MPRPGGVGDGSGEFLGDISRLFPQGPRPQPQPTNPPQDPAKSLNFLPPPFLSLQNPSTAYLHLSGKSGVFGRWRSDPSKYIKASCRGRRESGERDARVALGGPLGHRFCKGSKVRLRSRCFRRGLPSAPRARCLTDLQRHVDFALFFPSPPFACALRYR